jgi:hypothetical protein
MVEKLANKKSVAHKQDTYANKRWTHGYIQESKGDSKTRLT